MQRFSIAIERGVADNGGMRCVCLMLALAVGMFLGCKEQYRAKRWVDSDSAVMIQDMTGAANRGDMSHAREMVDALSADDPAVRFYAIASLKKLTDEDLGYVYYEEPERRKPAVEKWKAWLVEKHL